MATSRLASAMPYAVLLVAVGGFVAWLALDATRPPTREALPKTRRTPATSGRWRSP
jgi:hypothetical protein